MKKIILLITLYGIMVSACSNREDDSSPRILETYSEERFMAILDQMEKVDNLLLKEMRHDDTARQEYKRLADTLIHLVEHSDNPLLRVGTRAYAFSLEGQLFDIGALQYIVGNEDLMAEVPYRWTVVSDNEDSLTMEMEIPISDDKNSWIDLDISYFRAWEKDSTPALFSINIPRTLLSDTNQFYLLFVNTLSDTTGCVIRQVFGWDDAFHDVYEDACYIRFPLDVVLMYIENTDALIINYKADSRGVMHSTDVFKEQYLDYLKRFCRRIPSWINRF